MRRTLLAVGFALGALVTAAVANAQPLAGVALRWNHCFGEGTGLVSRAFACDTNAGFEELIGSFAINEDIPNVSGNEIVVDVSTSIPYCCAPRPNSLVGVAMPPPAGGPLPEWWKFRNPGTCRQTALTAVFAADPANTVCQDWAMGQQIGALGAYNIEFSGPGTARIIAVVAVPMTGLQTLSAGSKYYSFTLRISHARTVGTDACGGCSMPMYLVLRSIRVTTPVLANDVWLLGPLNGFDSDGVIWSPAPVPTRSTTWGAVKARFR